jgi:hypothetical protein
MATMEQYERTCRGSGDGMQTEWIRRNTGSPSGDRSRDQLATRESQAGPLWGGGEVRSTEEAG